ncbi:MAG: glycerol-3-phosphate 1-O-acyltransferase PlsY [Gammaproteobacteria bacterium]|nr:glycerol-3-phosphate 1-O-acyltransferase PlsY [Gammaproteobacteria bacterium]
MLADALLVLFAYLTGSIASAVLVCRAMGLPDPRVEGSKNPGATNVLRLGGKTAAGLTLAGDVLKGLLPVVVARLLSDSPAAAAGATLATFLGHLYPVYFGFKGGKGVATAFGAVTGLAWPVALAMGVVWLSVAAASRYASLASLAAALCAPLAAWILVQHPAVLTCLTLMAGLIFWRHRANIARLKAGSESRIGEKRGGTAQADRSG